MNQTQSQTEGKAHLHSMKKPDTHLIESPVLLPDTDQVIQIVTSLNQAHYLEK